MECKNTLKHKIEYLEAMLESIIGDSERQSIHQTSYLMNQIDLLKSRLIAIEVEEVFSQEINND
jgi:hypothetical protein